MTFLYLKSLHIIFVVTWFAGLFYIVRLFIYHTEAAGKEEPARSILISQYKIMSKRLWYMITWPSAVLVTLFAVGMLIKTPSYLSMPWMHVKLSMVVLLFLYHLKCHQIYKQLQNDEVKWTSTKLRLFNELATLFLFAIVFVVVSKNALDWLWSLLSLIVLALLLFAGIRFYKKRRARKQ